MLLTTHTPALGGGKTGMRHTRSSECKCATDKGSCYFGLLQTSWTKTNLRPILMVVKRFAGGAQGRGTGGEALFSDLQRR